jgi:hypothetical protein
MNNLTVTERKVLNNASQVLNLDVNLGDKIRDIINNLAKFGTPVNAIAATKTLTISGVVVHGETVTIHNPKVLVGDVYEFLGDAAQTKSAPGNIAVDVSAKMTKSTINLTIDTQPTAGDKMTIGSKTYTFVPLGTDNSNGEISVGSDLTTAQAAIVAAVNGTDGFNVPNAFARLGAFAANVSAVTALIGGVVGDGIVTTETFTTETNVFSGATLAGGADCLAADAVTALVAAITASDTQGVGAADGVGDTVDLTADVAGISGNDIEIGETMTNGAFTGDAVKLSGGVDGTESTDINVMVDNTYLYVCVAANTVSGRNWRRIALGEVF